ncbi:hypothetical protein [uncultured Sphingomonas sp.]|uniref:hypothetical protein n=1 Tax=uncultured Sphingomonas sp. TaxID=158754 RepID=UPI0025F0F1FC|nr:hypothetical protein [uncultured Sphingomonas sp.]
MRRFAAISAVIAFAAASPAATQVIPSQASAANKTSVKTRTRAERTPTPARPEVRRSNNFFGLPLLLPLLGLGGAGAALAAGGGGTAASAAPLAPPPASPQ